MRKVTTKRIDGKQCFFHEDGSPATFYEYHQYWAFKKGYKNFYTYALAQGSMKLKAPEQTYRIKTEYDNLPEGAIPIPDFPTYYATSDAQIWRWSTKRQCYLNIAQQTQKSGYNVSQLYDIDNVRRVKYVHRLVHDAFHGPCPEGYEVHHIDHDNSNNHADNLVCMPYDDHRRMKRKSYGPRRK